MYLKMLLACLLLSFSVYSQSNRAPDYIDIDSAHFPDDENNINSSLEKDSIVRGENDTLIPFFGNRPLRLAPYENRVIPYNSKLPLYVSISFENSKETNLEYFREDSATYLVYEYYKDEGPNDKILKSRGKKIVKENISDSSKSGSYSVAAPRPYLSIHTDYFKTFSKEGEWWEYEDSSTQPIYWTGNYENNKKHGLWQRKTDFLSDDFIIEQVYYSKDSATSMPCANLATTLPLTALQRLLTNSWELRSCDRESEPRMIYYKYEWKRDPYAEMMVGLKFYHLEAKKKFIRERGEGCYKFRETCTDGQWKLIETGGNRYVIINFTNGQEWKLKIIYIDADGNLVTERI